VNDAAHGYGPMEAKPEAIAAAREWLPAIAEMMRPATRDQRAIVLGRLLDHCAKPSALDGDERRIRDFWEAYHADLSSIPLDVLVDAAGEWRRGENRFYPRSGDLLAIVRKRGILARRIAEERGLERLAQAAPKRDVEPLSEEDDARLKALLARIGSLA
jgi:hypothetical protein